MERSAESTQTNAPILVVHLDQYIRRMMFEVLTLEGYAAQETGHADEALHILQASKNGMIVYLEPLFLYVQGHEQLHDYVVNRGLDNPHVFIVFTVLANLEAAMADIRADGNLMVPFTVQQLMTSVEEAQLLLKSKSAQA